MNDHLHPMFRDILNSATTPKARSVVADGVSAELVTFTAEEVRRGYAMRGNTKVYCCYGMYCDAGHSGDCKHIAGVNSCGEGQ